MPDNVTDLLATDASLDKLGARSISAEEAGQLLHNVHLTVRNPHERGPGTRRLVIGRTDGGRCVTLVIDRTVEPTTWLIVTGWGSTEVEPKMLEG